MDQASQGFSVKKLEIGSANRYLDIWPKRWLSMFLHLPGWWMASSRSMDTYWYIYGLRSKLGKPRGSIQAMRTRIAMEFCNEILGSASKDFSVYLIDRHFCCSCEKETHHTQKNYHLTFLDTKCTPDGFCFKASEVWNVHFSAYKLEPTYLHVPLTKRWKVKSL